MRAKFIDEFVVLGGALIWETLNGRFKLELPLGPVPTHIHDLKELDPNVRKYHSFSPFVQLYVKVCLQFKESSFHFDFSPFDFKTDVCQMSVRIEAGNLIGFRKSLANDERMLDFGGRGDHRFDRLQDCRTHL